MKFLLDTNIVSELRKGSRANESVSAWVAAVDPADLYLSVLVIGELRQGVEQVRRRDTTAAQRLDRWLTTTVEAYADRMIPVDGRVADLWGRLNVPDPLPLIDGLLAATAIAHGMTFVTRNVRQVARTGVDIHNPFAK
jgi:predicted nucleic acid-binding protein